MLQVDPLCKIAGGAAVDQKLLGSKVRDKSHTTGPDCQDRKRLPFTFRVGESPLFEFFVTVAMRAVIHDG